MNTFSLLTTVAASLLLACSGKVLDVGSDGTSLGGRAGSIPSGVGGTTSTSPPTDGSQPNTCTQTLVQERPWPVASECLPAPDSALIGTWRGHWPDPSDNINVEAELTIAGLTADGTPCGHIKIGEGSDAPP